MNWSTKAHDIKVVVMDIDGVLTDGRIGYGLGHDQEIKFFDVHDGTGIQLARRAGLKAGVLSGRRSLANQRRAGELKLDFIHEDIHVKAEGLMRLCADLAIEPRQCLYIGDDLIDLPPMRLSGISAAVGDAAEEVRRAADWVATRPGGRGAVREILERLLRLQGHWEQLLKRYV
jgi:3-deoxy-D-manno-octulosonate 8-phosphate phosphatase (KDO 8-P phosphatase)